MLNPADLADGRRRPSGEFVAFGGERYYVIRDVDAMPPFLVSVVSGGDHWLYASSGGGLTAGRESPEGALFPYLPSDKIHDCATHTGGKAILRVALPGRTVTWEPLDVERGDAHPVRRHLYKSVRGDKLCYEEVNDELGLAFRQSWATSEQFGFVRTCELENRSGRHLQVDLLDGMRNLLPAGTPRGVQATASNLVNAYRWTELFADVGLAVYSLYSGISDRAEPRESLRANVAFCLGLDDAGVLLSSRQLDEFRAGRRPDPETHTRGVRGAYFVCSRLDLEAGTTRRWRFVADTGKSQEAVVALREQLRDPGRMEAAIATSVAAGSDALARIVATADGLQSTGEEIVSAHHFANTLFNVLRGGVFADQYRIDSRDFAKLVQQRNRPVFERHRQLLGELPGRIDLESLQGIAADSGDAQLERLGREYLPLTFGRRHGDPSRPWNDFRIRLRDDRGNRLLAYEGNWRDIFQNWEALACSFPEFIESFVARFVNASTRDGHNPYRITREGIDWEVEEPDDPWSNIGYWGDHQLIYLLKFLELSRMHHPASLRALLHRRAFAYANVPYRIRAFESLLDNPKDTVDFDDALAAQIRRRVADIGADGKLVLDAAGEVYLVTLLEKLLVPLLAKLGNLVVGGGIWLNTQRPEWNDANNALVGHGLSMVTLCYMRRYVSFLATLLEAETGGAVLSVDVARWLQDTSSALANAGQARPGSSLDDRRRAELLAALGVAASRFRESSYSGPPAGQLATVETESIRALLRDALRVIDATMDANRRKDGLYHSYNVLVAHRDGLGVDNLYPMLEGQVAALSSGALAPDAAVRVVEALFDSDIYRADQRSFMLYPDRPLPGFLDKNRVPPSDVERIPLLVRMLEAGDTRIIVRDVLGNFRFHADFANARDLEERLDAVSEEYGAEAARAREPLRQLYENVFRHRLFTGRSGAMFGYEGLGSIYWHMVAKLLVAIAENFHGALERGAKPAVCTRLGELYYRVREGLGFNKSPAEYGAFPTDPYSHTPKHSGARQPGMTGQVKEELLCRYAELGVRIEDGCLAFRPALLRRGEFAESAASFRYLDVDGRWQELAIPERGLAFTVCQVPVVFHLDAAAAPGIVVTSRKRGEYRSGSTTLSREVSRDIFRRNGEVRRLLVQLHPQALFAPGASGGSD